MARFDLTDVAWSIIAPLLLGAEGKKNGRPRPDNRKVLNGIFFVLRTGTSWRDLPERDGPYTTVYNRFNRWAKVGIWVRISEALAAKSQQSLQLIDSSIIRAHQHAAGVQRGPDNAIGRSRGGLSTQIHAVVDQAGMPIRIVLSQASRPTRPSRQSCSKGSLLTGTSSRIEATTTPRDH
jgi:transposase